MKLYVCWGTFPVPLASPRSVVAARCASVRARARR